MVEQAPAASAPSAICTSGSGSENGSMRAT